MEVYRDRGGFPTFSEEGGIMDSSGGGGIFSDFEDV